MKRSANRAAFFTIELSGTHNPKGETTWLFSGDQLGNAQDMFNLLRITRQVTVGDNEIGAMHTDWWINLYAWDRHPTQTDAVALILEQYTPEGE